jgi:hypothetical protein
MGALAADRQALAVTQAAIAAQIHQPLDVHRHFAAQIAFDQIIAVDRFRESGSLGIGQIITRGGRRRDADLLADLLGFAGRCHECSAGDFDALLGRDIDAGDTRHGASFALRG